MIEIVIALLIANGQELDEHASTDELITQAESWKIDSREDKFDKDQRVFMRTMDVQDEGELKSKRDWGQLALVCEMGRKPSVSALLLQERYLGSHGDYLTVQYYFDEGEPEEERWTIWSDSMLKRRLKIKAKGTPPRLELDEFTSRVLQADVFNVRVFNYRSKSQTNSFQFRDTENAFRQFLMECYGGDSNYVEAIQSMNVE